MSDTLTPVPFFTDSITLVPHSVSSEIADHIEKPLTIGEFVKRTGARRVSLYTTGDNELLIQTSLPDGRQIFARGPERFPVYH
ncbi:hypothetical protein [Marinobacter sp. MBR-105]|jgi:hypothetical protein